MSNLHCDECAYLTSTGKCSLNHLFMEADICPSYELGSYEQLDIRLAVRQRSNQFLRLELAELELELAKRKVEQAEEVLRETIAEQAKYVLQQKQQLVGYLGVILVSFCCFFQYTEWRHQQQHSKTSQEWVQQDSTDWPY